jgi:hypothetical protein
MNASTSIGGTAGSAATGLPAVGKTQVRIGWAFSILTILFMLLDVAGKLALEAHTVDATLKIGFPVGTIRPIGIIALWPKTRGRTRIWRVARLPASYLLIPWCLSHC